MTIIVVRTIRSTNTELGVGRIAHDRLSDTWFVFNRQVGEDWHLRCGPYSTQAAAENWIRGVEER